MGLDITYYRKLTPIKPDAELSEEDCYDRYFKGGPSMQWSEGAFPGRAEPLKADQWYDYEDSDGFRAGSYTGYGIWRDRLAEFAGHDRAEIHAGNIETGVFIELIYFADNEGVIGPVVSAKLAKDFRDNFERARTFDMQDSWFFERYQDWTKAFEMAADGGAVDFH